MAWLAQARPQWSFLLVGHAAADVSALRALRNEAATQAPLPPPAKPAKKAAKPAAKKPAAQAEPTAAPVVEQGKHESLPLRLIRQAIEEASDDLGWAFLGSVGSYLRKVRPDFEVTGVTRDGDQEMFRVERMGNFRVGNSYFFGNACHQITAMDCKVWRRIFEFRQSGSNFNLDFLS